MLKKSEPSQFSNLYTAVNPKPRDIYDVRVFGCKYVYFVQGSTLTEFTAAETPSPSGFLSLRSLAVTDSDSDFQIGTHGDAAAAAASSSLR